MAQGNNQGSLTSRRPSLGSDTEASSSASRRCGFIICAMSEELIARCLGEDELYKKYTIK